MSVTGAAIGDGVAESKEAVRTEESPEIKMTYTSDSMPGDSSFSHDTNDLLRRFSQLAPSPSVSVLTESRPRASSSGMSVKIFKARSPPGHRRQANFCNSEVLEAVLNPKHRYLKWQGNNTFFCGGLVMTGAHPYQLLLSMAMLTATWLFFFFAILPFIHSIYLYAAALLCCTVNMVTLLATAFTEPGMYVRRTRSPEEDLLSPSDMKVFTKEHHYCTICGVFRHPRARHCKYCNNCVDVFDHHCPWTGNCIGRRNYAVFFAFITSVFLSTCYMLLVDVFLLVSSFVGIHSNHPLIRGVASVMLLGWVGFVWMLITALLAFHIFLLLTQQTTFEYFKAKRQRQGQATSSEIASSSQGSGDEQAGSGSVWQRLRDCTARIALLIMKPAGFSCTAVLSICCAKRKRYEQVPVPDQPPHWCDLDCSSGAAEDVKSNSVDMPRGRQTRLLPMWQYESQDDIIQQDEILADVLQRMAKDLPRGLLESTDSSV